MNDPWREYFIPVPVLDPTADELIHGLPTKQDVKDSIEHILAIRSWSDSHDEAMKMLRHMLPEKVWVVAENYSVAMSFGQAIRRKINHVSSHRSLMGMEGFTIVFIGNYFNHQEYKPICAVLQGRRSFERWDIREWRNV